MTDDDKRHGTTTLFAALDIKSGMVIGELCRATGLRTSCVFLCLIDRAVLNPRDVHWSCRVFVSVQVLV